MNRRIFSLISMAIIVIIFAVMSIIAIIIVPKRIRIQNLLDKLDGGSPLIRSEAKYELKKYNEEVIPYLEPILIDETRKGKNAIELYCDIRGFNAIPKLVELFERTDDIDKKRYIITMMGGLKSRESLRQLIRYIGDENVEVAVCAYFLLLNNLIKDCPFNLANQRVRKDFCDVDFRERIFSKWSDWLINIYFYLEFNTQENIFVDSRTGNDSLAREYYFQEIDGK